MSVAFIVHGAVWPDEHAVSRLGERLLRAAPAATIVEARGDPRDPHQAAATINSAIARTTAEILVVVEASAEPDASWVARAIAAASPGVLAIEADDRGQLPFDRTDDAVPPDLATELAALSARSIPDTPGPSARGATWAITREAFVKAGHLDERLGSVGYLEDFARMVPHVAVHGSTRSSEPSAWPLDPMVERTLRARNRLITAFKTLPPDALGAEIARVATAQILAAWRASGWRAEAFHFGGSWGRQEGRLARVLWPGRHGAARLDHHEGVLAPLLALDGFLDQAPGLLAERRRRVAAMPGAPGDEAPSSERPGATGLHTRNPSVSVIIVNWNGRQHLDACFRSLLASDYPRDRLEIVCVDNGSSDGSVELVRRDFPSVQMVTLASNLGFTGGNEAGVAASTGDVLVFFNNDMRVAPDAISRLVGALDATTACAAARVLDWSGTRIDFLRGALSFEGRGFQDFYGEPATRERQSSADTFFANGGAFAVTRQAYVRAGGFDPTLFAYYDDVDLGWRLRLTGTSIRVEDRAVAYHRHGSTGSLQPAGQKRFLMERNALLTLAKDYGETALRRTLGATLLLTVRRLLDDSRLARGRTRLAGLAPFCRRVRRTFDPPTRADTGPTASAPVLVRGFAAESFAALGAALSDLPRLAAARAVVQRARTVSDRDVLSHLGRTFESLSAVSSYRPIQEALVRALDMPRVFNARTRVLIISHEAIAANMSGPAVRFLELGRALSTVARVTVAAPGQGLVRDDRCTIATFDPAAPAALERLAEDADVLFVQGFTLTQYPFLADLMLPIVVDLYCPFTIEHLEQTRGDAVRAQDAAAILGVQNVQLDAGDFFICASETQRDFWIGNLHARGRVNPLTYADDPTLRALIDVVPFGLADEDVHEAVARARAVVADPRQTDAPSGPHAAGNVMKGGRAGIGVDDKVLLWAGSLLDWQDPLTLIRAVATLAATRADVKLFFMGTKHPNPLVTPMRIVEESRRLARELGLLDTHVFFNDWVPYDQRARYLVEADLGVSTHRDHLETHFSFRTRMLDYLWAGLPIVCTRGDVFADLVAARRLGATVPPGDSDALAAAITALLDSDERRAEAAVNAGRLAGEMRWSRVVAPLADFCRRPRHAADHTPGIDALRARLEGKFAVTKWMKRTALRAGVSEMRVEQVKRLKVVQGLMTVRNKIALARARR